MLYYVHHSRFGVQIGSGHQVCYLKIKQTWINLSPYSPYNKYLPNDGGNNVLATFVGTLS